jgi:dihydroorotase
MALNPSVIVGIKRGTLKPGADADLVVIDTGKEYRVDPSRFSSKGKNTPCEGWTLRAKAAVTISLGRIYEWE